MMKQKRMKKNQQNKKISNLENVWNKNQMKMIMNLMKKNLITMIKLKISK